MSYQRKLEGGGAHLPQGTTCHSRICISCIDHIKYTHMSPNTFHAVDLVKDLHRILYSWEEGGAPPQALSAEIVKCAGRGGARAEEKAW